LSTASEQVGVWQTRGKPPQILLVQSVPARHALPLAHFGQSGPPQSTAVSDPFLMASVQLGKEHNFDRVSHLPLRQSLFTKHAMAAPQGEHAGPPQSTAVSVLFFWPSVQEPS